MTTFLLYHWLDLLTTLLGLAYILLEYRASIYLWAVGFAMQVLGIVLYYQKGLYADCGMEIYYICMTVYGFMNWKFGFGGKKKAKPAEITHIPAKIAFRWIVIAMAVWALIYWILVTFTDSKVPIADSFTTAFSLMGIWALARKYIEQWLVWIVVDIVTCQLYFYKDIPFKASLYCLYIVIAIFGYRKWKKMMFSNQ